MRTEDLLIVTADRYLLIVTADPYLLIVLSCILTILFLPDTFLGVLGVFSLLSADSHF